MNATTHREPTALLMTAKVLQWLMVTGILAAFVYALPWWALAVGCVVFVGMLEVRG